MAPAVPEMISIVSMLNDLYVNLGERKEVSLWSRLGGWSLRWCWSGGWRWGSCWRWGGVHGLGRRGGSRGGGWGWWRRRRSSSRSSSGSRSSSSSRLCLSGWVARATLKKGKQFLLIIRFLWSFAIQVMWTLSSHLHPLDDIIDVPQQVLGQHQPQPRLTLHRLVHINVHIHGPIALK